MVTVNPLRRRRRVLGSIVETASGAENAFKVIDGILVQGLVLPGDQVAQVSGTEGAIHVPAPPPEPKRPVDLRVLDTFAASAVAHEPPPRATRVDFAGYGP